MRDSIVATVSSRHLLGASRDRVQVPLVTRSDHNHVGLVLITVAADSPAAIAHLNMLQGIITRLADRANNPAKAPAGQRRPRPPIDANFGYSVYAATV
jgi:hypothetical protein